eukprot:1094964-Pyramimonas_sp.AAC.1
MEDDPGGRCPLAAPRDVGRAAFRWDRLPVDADQGRGSGCWGPGLLIGPIARDPAPVLLHAVSPAPVELRVPFPQETDQRAEDALGVPPGQLT